MERQQQPSIITSTNYSMIAFGNNNTCSTPPTAKSGSSFSSSSPSSSSSMAMMMMVMPPLLTNSSYQPEPTPPAAPPPPGSSSSIQNNLHNLENSSSSSCNTNNMKAKIMTHPLFPRLISAYVNCQKIGAPPEVAAGLDRAEAEAMATMGMGFGNKLSSGTGTGTGGWFNEDDDPALNQFMEAYCEMLTKYEQELTKPIKDAMYFFSRIDSQIHALAAAAAAAAAAANATESACDANTNLESNSQEDQLNINSNSNYDIDPQAEDRELKVQLLRKYSGYVGCLKQEFMKKKKNGKLPKEARQQLLDWWSKHYKWPYPSESQKMGLAESTGLDLKQINNWFINQRKRHWKPSEDMQFVLMDENDHNNAHPHYYIDNVVCSAYPMDCTSTLL